MWKFYLQKTGRPKRISYQELEKTNIERFSVKVRTKSSIERTVMIDFKFKMCCLYQRGWSIIIFGLYVVLVLLGSVETQLGWSGKFC